MTGCSSSSVPTRVERSALTPPPARRPRPGPRRRAGRSAAEAHRAAVAGAVAAGHGRLERDLAGHARARAGRGDRAHEAVGPGGEDAGCAREPRRQQVEHVGGRERDLALCRGHELGGTRRVRRRGRPRAARASGRRRASGASSATPNPPPTSRGAAPAAAGSKPRPNGPSTSTSAPTWASAASAGPRGWQRNVTPESSEATAESGRARNESCASARSMWNCPGSPPANVGSSRTCTYGPSGSQAATREGVKRAAPAGSWARPARRARSPARLRWRRRAS